MKIHFLLVTQEPDSTKRDLLVIYIGCIISPSSPSSPQQQQQKQKQFLLSTTMSSARKSQPPPKVTGLSPKEGPPGTKLTIRGENFGSSIDDLIGVTIAGVDVLIYTEFVSHSKIITRSPRFKGISDVILTTRYGGIGTCTVQFRGYEEAVSLNKESAVWVNEDELLVFSTNQRHRSTSSPTLTIIDPLNIEYDENQRDGEEREIDDNEIEMSSLITSKSFDPALFLVKRHKQASFAQLKEGLKTISKHKIGRSDSTTLNSSSISFLKPNVLSVVECLDAMKSVNQALKIDRKEHGTDLTFKIEDSLKKAESEAHQIFDSVLSKKELADSTRNALNVLQRYRFLFNLPSSIERNASKGDYDVVINDYSRAKALFEKNEVGIFKRVYGEVENRVHKLEKTLQDKLDQCCVRQQNRNIDELKKLIRHLVQLGVNYNPAWESILKIKQELMDNLYKCRDVYLEAAKKQTDQIADPPHVVLFVDESVKIFRLYFPDLIRLGHDYLSGNLYTRETESSLKSKEAIFETEMIQEVIRCLVSLMRSALLPSQLGPKQDQSKVKSDNMAVWLPSCLRTIIGCYQSLLRQEMALSPIVLQPMHQLIFDFRVYSLGFLFNVVSDEIKQLYMKENWDVTSDNSIGTRTQLPVLFEAKVKEILQLVRENILQTNTPDEVDIFSQINVQGQVKQLAQNLLQSFIVSLEKTLTEKIPSVPKSNYSQDDRLLIVLCNCIFVVSHMFPYIQESFEKLNYPDMTLVLKVSQSKYKEFEGRLLNQFIEQKRDLVIGSIEPSMYASSNEWYAPKSRPNDISYYVKEMLMNLIAVQGQVFLIAPFLVRKIMLEVIEAAIEEVTRLHDCVADRFNENGNLQAKVDFEALKIILGDIDSETTDRLLNSSSMFLKSVRPSDAEQMNRLLNQMKQSLHLQLYCFRWEADQPVIVI